VFTEMWSSGSRHSVASKVFTNILEQHMASMSRVVEGNLL
jgi:hypothetical protein